MKTVNELIKIKKNLTNIDMKTLEQVLDDANASYDEEIRKNPLVHKESGRTAFILGWLESAYERLLNEYNAIRIA